LKTCLAVDPGKRDCGVAYFVDGVLDSAAFLETADGDDVTLTQMVVDWLDGGCDLLVTEDQQVYARGKGDPNDLVPLARVVGGVRSRIEHAERVLPLPRIWTGGVPKDVRHRKLLERLPAAEVAIIDAVKVTKAKKHNVIDAVALGVWVLEQRGERVR